MMYLWCARSHEIKERITHNWIEYMFIFFIKKGKCHSKAQIKSLQHTKNITLLQKHLHQYAELSGCALKLPKTEMVRTCPHWNNKTRIVTDFAFAEIKKNEGDELILGISRKDYLLFRFQPWFQWICWNIWVFQWKYEFVNISLSCIKMAHFKAMYFKTSHGKKMPS